MKSQLLKLVMCLLLFAPIITSQNAPLPNGVQTHDGFFLRITPGFGYSSVSETLPDNLLPAQYKGKDVMSFSGGFPVANTIQIGGTVSENLIIYGESGGIIMSNPTVKVFEEEVEDPGDVLVYLGGIGPGMTYYFMPSNIYLSATILASFAMVHIEGAETQNSNIGFGFNFMVGKEWWAGEQWGLGVSAYFRYGSQTDQDIDDLTISGYSFGLLFSVTYN